MLAFYGRISLHIKKIENGVSTLIFQQEDAGFSRFVHEYVLVMEEQLAGIGFVPLLKECPGGVVSACVAVLKVENYSISLLLEKA